MVADFLPTAKSKICQIFPRIYTYGECVPNRQIPDCNGDLGLAHQI